MQQRIYCSCEDEDIYYPSEKFFYSPSVKYPEYPFEDIAEEENKVYSIIRNGLYRLGYDRENYGTKDWNPLGEIIKPGDTVLLKPNWVMHVNPEEKYHDMECLVTNPSLIRTITDYVVIALKGTGRIILADAPMAQCHINKLYTEMHYDVLSDFYTKQGIDIQIIDMRGVSFDDNTNKFGMNKIVNLNDQTGVIVDIGNKSAFMELPEEKLSSLAAPKLDPQQMRKHHNKKRQEYSIHKAVLEADVIINLPKPKSHRKAGMTACCKNFIGVNVRKDLLPHLTYGSVSEKGDAYQKRNLFLTLSNRFNERYDYYTFRNRKNQAVLFRVLKGLCRRIGIAVKKEAFWEGSWYGNDTIWRTICDVDNAVYYADKNGVFCDGQEPQRRICRQAVLEEDMRFDVGNRLRWLECEDEVQIAFGEQVHKLVHRFVDDVEFYVRIHFHE